MRARDSVISAAALLPGGDAKKAKRGRLAGTKPDQPRRGPFGAGQAGVFRPPGGQFRAEDGPNFGRRLAVVEAAVSAQDREKPKPAALRALPMRDTRAAEPFRRAVSR